MSGPDIAQRVRSIIAYVSTAHRMGVRRVIAAYAMSVPDIAQHGAMRLPRHTPPPHRPATAYAMSVPDIA
eukprot:1386058-Rhodomonas_salina.1